MEELFTRDSIEINAPLSVIWEILITPKYIKEWEDFPADWGGKDRLTIGREIVWRDEEGNPSVKGTVIKLEPERLLQVTLHDVNMPPAQTPEDFSYTYTLTPQDNSTLLSVALGDFSKILHGEKYHKEASEFDSQELRKIKELAEGEQ